MEEFVLWSGSENLFYFFGPQGQQITHFPEKGSNRLFGIGDDGIIFLLIENFLHTAAMNLHGVPPRAKLHLLAQ